MEGRQHSVQDNIDASLIQELSKKKNDAFNVDTSAFKTSLDFKNKVKIMNMKSKSLPTLSLLAKNVALLPSEIVHVKDAVLNQISSTSSSTSTIGTY
jgi:hypothetical protein